MSERDEIPAEVSILTDVNAVAIGLTDDHPVHGDVFPWIRDALDGPNTLLVPDYYLLRAQYIMTRNFGVETVAARNAVQSLLDSPARIVGATEAVLSAAYDISDEKDHDVYDSFVLAMARAHEADYLVTTDDDFESLCADEDVTYRNPIPPGERDRLSLADG